MKEQTLEIRPCSIFDGFNVVPGYNNYCVNKQGKVMCRRTRKEVKHKLSRDGNILSPVINVRCPFRGPSNIRVARLVYISFVEPNLPAGTAVYNSNDDFTKIELDKLSIEQSSVIDSSAFANKHLNDPILAIDVFTGQTYSFDKVTDAAEQLRMARTTLQRTIMRYPQPRVTVSGYMLRYASEPEVKIEKPYYHMRIGNGGMINRITVRADGAALWSNSVAEIEKFTGVKMPTMLSRMRRDGSLATLRYDWTGDVSDLHTCPYISRVKRIRNLPRETTIKIDEKFLSV